MLCTYYALFKPHQLAVSRISPQRRNAVGDYENPDYAVKTQHTPQHGSNVTHITLGVSYCKTAIGSEHRNLLHVRYIYTHNALHVFRMRAVLIMFTPNYYYYATILQVTYLGVLFSVCHEVQAG